MVATERGDRPKRTRSGWGSSTKTSTGVYRKGEHIVIYRLARKKRALSQRPLVLAALLGSALIAAFAISGAAVANTSGCTNTAATLTGSAFEIDTDANLVVDNSGCIDWLTGGSGSGLRT